MGGLTLAPFASGAPLIKLDLRIALVDTPSALVGTLQYATALWARETVARLGVRLQQVLAAMVADPTQRVRALPLVTADEQAQWDAAPRDAAAPCVAVPAQIAAQAAATPDAVALVGEAPDVEAATAIRAAGASLPLGAVPQVTYGTLWARASALAAALRAWGVGPEVRVAVCLDRGVDSIVALLGVLEAGGAYVPLDPHDPAARLAWLLDEAHAPMILTSEALRDRLPAHWAQVVALDTAWPTIAATAAAGASAARASGPPAPETLAYVIYTSGSTGRPKGVGIPHGAFAHYVTAIRARLAWAPAWRTLLLTSPTADLGHTVLWPTLCAGGGLHVVSAETARDGARVAAVVTREGIACLKVTPSHLQALDTAAPGVLPSACLILGGEAGAPAWVATWARRAPGCASGITTARPNARWAR